MKPKWTPLKFRHSFRTWQSHQMCCLHAKINRKRRYTKWERLIIHVLAYSICTTPLSNSFQGSCNREIHGKELNLSLKPPRVVYLKLEIFPVGAFLREERYNDRKKMEQLVSSRIQPGLWSVCVPHALFLREAPGRKEFPEAEIKRPRNLCVSLPHIKLFQSRIYDS